MDVPYLFDLSIGYYTANLESSFSEVVWKNIRHKLPNEDIIKGGFSTGAVIHPDRKNKVATKSTWKVQSSTKANATQHIKKILWIAIQM